MSDYVGQDAAGCRAALAGLRDPDHWESALHWARGMRAAERNGDGRACDPRLRAIVDALVDGQGAGIPVAAFADRYRALNPPPHGDLTRGEWRDALLVEFDGGVFDWAHVGTPSPTAGGDWWPSLAVAMFLNATPGDERRRFEALPEGLRGRLRPWARFARDLRLSFGVFIPGDADHDAAVVAEVERRAAALWAEHGGVDAGEALAAAGAAHPNAGGR